MGFFGRKKDKEKEKEKKGGLFGWMKRKQADEPEREEQIVEPEPETDTDDIAAQMLAEREAARQAETEQWREEAEAEIAADQAEAAALAAKAAQDELLTEEEDSEADAEDEEDEDDEEPIAVTFQPEEAESEAEEVEPETVKVEPEAVAEPETVEPEPEAVAESETVESELEEVAEPETVETEPEAVAEPETVETEPEEIAEPETVESEPEEIAEPETVEPEPEEIAEPETVETEPEEVAEPETEEVEPEEVAEPETVETEPEEIAEPETVETEPEEVAEPETEEVEPEEVAEPETEASEPEEFDETEAEASEPEEPQEPEKKKKKGFFEKIRDGLRKTKDSVIAKMQLVLNAFTKIDEDLFDQLEETMIMGDMGAETSIEICDQLRKRVKERGITDPKQIMGLIQEIIGEMLGEDQTLQLQTKPSVIMVIGVNGAGKTTTIGKLCHQLKEDGKKVIVAAADTFRAAAIDQLEVWTDRAGVELVKHAEGSDPAAVVYDAIEAAKARNCDVLICDTAGRLHNKKNLMQELAKINRIIENKAAGCDKEILLVLDATTGQNAVNQARLFKEVADITGIVLTKLDGTAKGGIIVSIKNELEIPVKLIGVGEKIDDLQPFHARDFVNALFETEERK
jgi:fused signal recognition particle receptor